MSSTDSGVHNPRASLSRTRIKASPLPLTAPIITMTKKREQSDLVICGLDTKNKVQ